MLRIFVFIMILLLWSLPVYAADPDDYIDLRFRTSTRTETAPQKEPGRAAESPITAATHRPGEIWTDPDSGMEFVWIPAGCFMMGRVGEWCRDVYDPKAYSRHARRNPLISVARTSVNTGRIYRGGRWDSINAKGYSVAGRYQGGAYGYYNLGFRLVRTE